MAEEYREKLKTKCPTVEQNVGNLSGGNQQKVLLAKWMFADPDVLILDEPTNHLDILSKEILEDALNAYTGTVLYVSHDRYFINKTATRILDLDHAVLTNYLGNYEYYLEKKEAQVSVPSDSHSAPAIQSSQTPDTKQNWKAQKEQQAAQRKRENELRKCEEAIEQLEQRNTEIDLLMASPEVCTNVEKLQELSKERETNETKLK